MSFIAFLLKNEIEYILFLALLSKRFKLMKHTRFSNNRLAVKTVIFCCSGAIVMHLSSPKQPTGSRQLIPGCMLLARTDKH